VRLDSSPPEKKNLPIRGLRQQHTNEVTTDGGGAVVGDNDKGWDGQHLWYRPRPFVSNPSPGVGFGKPPSEVGPFRWRMPKAGIGKSPSEQRLYLRASVWHHYWALSVRRWLAEMDMKQHDFQKQHPDFLSKTDLSNLLKGDAILEVTHMAWFLAELGDRKSGPVLRPPSPDLLINEFSRAETEAMRTGRAGAPPPPPPPAAAPRKAQGRPRKELL
jgi:hypothetical protein